MGKYHGGKAGKQYRIVFFLLFQMLLSPNSVFASQSSVQYIDTDAFAGAYFIPDQKRATLRAYLVFNQGELHNSGAEGLAHYVEHLAWLNALDEPDSSRHTNAWTNLYSTGYWVEFDSADYKSQLGRLLHVVEPWTRDERFMLEERTVIQQEYNINHADDPYLTINLERKDALLGGTVFSRSVIGTPDTISQFDLDNARRLHRMTHKLENATLLVTGSSSTEQIAQWLKVMNLPSIDRQGKAQKLPNIDLPLIVDDQNSVSKTIPESTFYFEKLTRIDDCGSPAQCDAVFRILGSVIDSTLPGGIANALRFDNFITRTFSFDLYRLGDSHAVVSFIAEPDSGVSLETLDNAFMDVWSGTASEGIPRESVERVRKRILDDIDIIMDKPAQAMGMALDQLSLGEPVYSPEEQLSALLAVDYVQIASLLKKLHDDGRLVVRRISRTDR